MTGQNKIQIAPAVARLSQVYARANQLSFPNRVARLIVAEAILALDPLLDLCVDEGSSLSEIDALARVISVNDIVVNGRHIDVAVINSESQMVTLPAALAQSRYGANGSLVVRLSDTASGAVVGYLKPQAWQEANISNAELFEQEFAEQPDFELEKCLEAICANDVEPSSTALKSDLQAADYMHFLREPSTLPVNKQIKILDNCLSDPAVAENMTALSEFQADNLSDILRQSSTWESRINTLCARLKADYPDWTTVQLEEVLRSAGSKCGGQPQSPAFKLELTRLLLGKKDSSALSTKVRDVADSVLEQLFAGKKAVEQVHEYVKNQIAVEIAAKIQEQRQGLLNFSQATADEITSALRQLSLQPAYATHSQSETSAVDDINEALQLLAIVKIGDELDYMLSEV